MKENALLLFSESLKKMQSCEQLGARKVFYAVVDHNSNWRVSSKKYIRWLPAKTCEDIVKHETKDHYKLVMKEKRLSVFMTDSHAYVILRLNEVRPEFARKPTIRYDFERKIIKRLPMLPIAAGIALAAFGGYKLMNLKKIPTRKQEEVKEEEASKVRKEEEVKEEEKVRKEEEKVRKQEEKVIKEEEVRKEEVRKEEEVKKEEEVRKEEEKVIKEEEKVRKEEEQVKKEEEVRKEEEEVKKEEGKVSKEQEEKERQEEKALGINLQYIVNKIKNGSHEIIIAFGTSKEKSQLFGPDNSLYTRVIKRLAGCNVKITDVLVEASTCMLFKSSHLEAFKDKCNDFRELYNEIDPVHWILDTRNLPDLDKTYQANLYVVSEITCGPKIGYLTIVDGAQLELTGGRPPVKYIIDSINIMFRAIQGARLPIQGKDPVCLTADIFNALQKLGKKTEFTVIFYEDGLDQKYVRFLKESWNLEEKECLKLITDYPFKEYYKDKLQDSVTRCNQKWDKDCEGFCTASTEIKAVSFNYDKVAEKVKQGGNQIIVVFGNSDVMYNTIAAFDDCDIKRTIFEESMGAFMLDYKTIKSKIHMHDNDLQLDLRPMLTKPGQYLFDFYELGAKYKNNMVSRGHLYVIHKITCGDKIGYLTIVFMADPHTPKEVADEFFTTPYADILSGFTTPDANIQTKDNMNKEEALERFKEAFFIYESLNLMKISVRGCVIKKQKDWTKKLTGRLTDKSCPWTKIIFDALKQLGENPKFTFLFPDGKFENVKESLKKKCW
jgi:actin-related protein